MKTICTLLLMYCACTVGLYSQNVGINADNTPPDPSALLDLKSTTKGLLIPRMTSSERNAILTPALGLLVYDKTTLSFWYYGSDGWVALPDELDKAWYVEGTTEVPMTNSGDIYHMGRIAIGRDSARYAMDIESADTRTLNIVNTFAPSSQSLAYGTYLQMSGEGQGACIGNYTEHTGSGNGGQIGNYNIISNDGNGMHSTIWNGISGSGSGTTYGLRQAVTNTGSATLFGIESAVYGDGTGERTGFKNIVSGKGAKHTGIQNSVYGDSSQVQIALSQFVYTQHDEDLYGIKNYVETNGYGTIYGDFNEVKSWHTGSHYGTYNKVSNIGGSGTQVAGYFAASGTGTNYAAIFDYGHVIVNEYGGKNNFRVESDEKQYMLFVNGEFNRVGIGTASPATTLSVYDTVAASNIMQVINADEGSLSDGIAIQIGPNTNPTTSNQFLIFRDGNGTYLGSVSGNGTGGVQFNTTSDRRLKSNIRTYTDGLELVGKMRPCSYVMNSNPEVEQTGFIAQEMFEIFPQAVGGTPEDPIETPMTIDYSKLTPVLVSAIQQLQKENELLRADLEQIKSQLGQANPGNAQFGQTN